MNKQLLCFVLCISLLGVALSSNGGVKLTISQNALTYVKNVGVSILQGELKSIKLPDIHQDAHSPIGKVKVELSDMVMNSVSLSQNQVALTLVPGTNGISVSITNLAAELALHWHYKMHGFPHTSDSGSGHISVSSVNVALTLSISEKAGHPTASVSAASVHVGHLDIHLHGGASWLYNFLIKEFSGHIKSAVESSLHSTIVNTVNSKVQAALATVPVDTQLDEYSNINYKLTAVPQISSTYLDTMHLGEVYLNSHPTESPLTPPPMPTVETKSMVEIFFSDYVANTAADVYYQSGIMEGHITQANLPSWLPLTLNTTSWRFLVPELYKQYPDYAMKIDITAAKGPRVSFDPKDANVTAWGYFEIQVQDPTTENLTNAFVLEVTVHLLADVFLVDGPNGQSISGKLTRIAIDLALVKSTIGSFNPSVLETLLNGVIDAGILPLVNKKIGNGFPIPAVSGIKFLNPHIDFGNGYVHVATDIQYTP
eukprot:GCRY01000066.1.p1 GENE.GCRY01000066.1~~GCRY01000066.1.p1  ORF type:complete len:484 (-),score=113.49 GCRY01000066.1:147-1598(-)